MDKVDDIKIMTGWIWKYLGGPFAMLQSRLQLIPRCVACHWWKQS